MSARALPGAYAYLALAVLTWGGTFHATTIAGPHVPAPMLACLRATIAGGLLFAVLVVMRRRFSRRAWLWAAATGTLLVTIPYVAATEAILLAGAGNAAVLINSSPLFVLVIGRVVLGEAIRPLAAGGMVVALAGIGLMVSSQIGGAIAAGDLLGGMAVGLGCAASFGTGTLVLKRALDRDAAVDPVTLTACQHLVAVPVLLAVAVAFGGIRATQWSEGDMWTGLAYLSLGSSLAGYMLFLGALARAHATSVAAWLFLVPVVAVVIELALGRLPSALTVAGMLLVIAGVALTTVTPRSSPVESPPAVAV
jgi:probable blue pigment (indigoidine) exporter